MQEISVELDLCTVWWYLWSLQSYQADQEHEGHWGEASGEALHGLCVSDIEKSGPVVDWKRTCISQPMWWSLPHPALTIKMLSIKFKVLIQAPLTKNNYQKPLIKTYESKIIGTNYPLKESISLHEH